VEAGAELAPDVVVDAHARVGAHVKVGAGTVLHHGAIVSGWTTVGERNHIHPYACVGVVPQDKKYRGERADLVIGNDNIIREHVTISIGTEGGGGATRIGDRNLFMASSHVGHDCIVSNDCVIANFCGLAGHCRLDDFAILGGQAGLHQFVRVGAHVMVSGGSKVGKDVPPFTIAQGYPARLRGVNFVGLKRRGFSDEAIRAVKLAYRSIFVAQDSKITDSIARVRDELGQVFEVQVFLKFLEESLASERGFLRAPRGDENSDEDDAF
jgi:UDP-N-acetylglucosamine acyltransferase